jgi:mono/diheme cytochrome c family protein
LSTLAAVPLLMLVLVPMLMARQFLQDRQLAPLAKQLDRSAVAMRAKLAPFREESLTHYKQRASATYADPQTFYRNSCAFCHGAEGDGRGPEAANLVIPPENLAALRTNRPHLLEVLRRGVPGTGMPYFSFFDGDKLDALVDYLDGRFGVLSPPEKVPIAIAPAARMQAETVYAQACSVCHGRDGRPSELARGFEPPPPDFTVHQLSPGRAFEVITEGYPGTVMPPFAALPEAVRWALVELVQQQGRAAR